MRDDCEEKHRDQRRQQRRDHKKRAQDRCGNQGGEKVGSLITHKDTSGERRIGEVPEQCVARQTEGET